MKQFFEDIMHLLNEKFSFVKRGAEFDLDHFLHNSIPWSQFNSKARAAFDRDVFEIRKLLRMNKRLVELDMPVEHAAIMVGVNN